jgi:hypothetical protein
MILVPLPLQPLLMREMGGEHLPSYDAGTREDPFGPRCRLADGQFPIVPEDSEGLRIAI